MGDGNERVTKADGEEWQQAKPVVVDDGNERVTEVDGAEWQQAKRPLVVSAAGIIVGLGVASSFDQRVGGVVLLAAWLVGLWALHRLGRTGSIWQENKARAPKAKAEPDSERE